MERGSIESMDRRSNFLALILLDALEDGNEVDVYNILERNSLNASYVPLERGIAPIHYVCGMENESFAIDVMKKFLQSKADPNVRTDEQMTPLHVAAIYGRVEIVKLLLSYGASLDVWDDNRKMPVHYAIDECHFDVVQLMRDHIFLQKYEKRKEKNIYQQNDHIHSIASEKKLENSFNNLITENKNISTPVKSKSSNEPVNKHLQVPGFETNSETPGGSKYTPNRIHYNYDVTSPYYINITHRRHKPQPLFPPIETPKESESEGKKTSSDTEESSTDSQPVNIFALTKENLKELSERLPCSERSRISIIEMWREKVRQSRVRQSILKEFDDAEELVDNVIANDDLNFTNTLLKERLNPKEEDADSGACNSDSVICLDDGLEQDTKKSIVRPSLAFGTLIQKMAKAQLVETPLNNNISNSHECLNIKENENPNSTYETVPEMPEIEPNKSGRPEEKSVHFLTVPERADQNCALKAIASNRSTGDYFLQMTEAYVHTDDENGLVFYETKLLSNENARKNVKLKKIPERYAKSNKAKNDPHHDTSATSRSTDLTLPLDYETDTLRAELVSFGEAPGPITKSTKRLYIKRLIKYKRNIHLKCHLNRNLLKESKFSVELQRTLNNVDYFEKISDFLNLESKSSEFFANLKQKKNMREGHLKQSFIYMLIDPRISANLPGESIYLDKLQIWKRFLDSIFYVGKGKTSRPYSHLYDAMKTHSRLHELQNNPQASQNKKFSVKKSSVNVDMFKSPPTKSSDSLKLDRILDIWGNGSGVVCLHVFHNIVPVDAYTREAAMIDALSLKHLTNCKRGDYYGPSKTWTMKEKKSFGIALLYKAMQIFLAEGESQLSPSDLI